MFKKSFFINKDWNLSLILIPILLSFFISLYVLLDVDKSTESLKSLYDTASLKLENTFFANDYNKDSNLKLLDNLNKLYVATTRAKDRLYIFSKSSEPPLKNRFRHYQPYSSMLTFLL